MKNFIEKTIREAGDIANAMYQNVNADFSKEDPHQIITEADTAIQKSIVTAIREAYPGHDIVGEEDGVKEYSGAEYTWYVDPIDGTGNFANQIPLYGINIAVAQNNQLLHAAVFNPATNELCTATEGKGTYLNGKKVSCTDRTSWENSKGVGPMSITDQKHIFIVKGIGKISNGSGWMNSFGSTAATSIYLASGRRDWYVALDDFVYDNAAPALIMKEAGCIVTDTNGDEWSIDNPNDLIVANEAMHGLLLEVVKHYRQ